MFYRRERIESVKLFRVRIPQKKVQPSRRILSTAAAKLRTTTAPG
jgi:hypothetical protein